MTERTLNTNLKIEQDQSTTEKILGVRSMNYDRVCYESPSSIQEAFGDYSFSMSPEAQRVMKQVEEIGIDQFGCNIACFKEQYIV